MAIASAKQFEKAWALCSNLWFPMNQRLLQQLLTRIDNDSYTNRKELLIKDIKEDPALFCHCIREATTLYRASPKKRLRPTQPRNLLYSIELSHIERILRKAQTSSSAHSFEQRIWTDTPSRRPLACDRSA